MIAWILAHPELATGAVLSLLSLVAHLVELKSPRAAAIIRAVAVDLPGLVRALRPMKAEKPDA